jgi:hypothetical protein
MANNIFDDNGFIDVVRTRLLYFARTVGRLNAIIGDETKPTNLRTASRTALVGIVNILGDDETSERPFRGLAAHYRVELCDALIAVAESGALDFGDGYGAQTFIADAIGIIDAEIRQTASA